MKKRNWIWVILIIGLLASGCQNTDDSKVAVIEEIPIENEMENAQIESAEGSTETEISAQSGQVADTYEEIDVEVNGNNGTITVGTTGAPFTELLMQAKIQLAKEGWDLQIKKYEDYKKINEDVLNGTLDAHLFAHRTYIDSYNDVNGTNLSSVNQVCYEVYGIYSETNQDLTNVSEGSVIGIPEDDTRKARALLFMQNLGWIVLKENVGITAMVDDIVENTKDLQFVEYTLDTIPQIMSETDYCIIGADMAIAAGLDAEDDVLKTETSKDDSVQAFASLLIATEENVQTEKMSILSQVFKTEAMHHYIEETYRGALALCE